MKAKTAFAMLKEQEKETRRNLIVEAAQRVFAAKPYGKVSMREIAKEANISAPSIYTYFPDQETLLIEAAFQGTRAMIDAFTARMADKKDRRLEEVAEAFIRYLTEHDVYFRMMAHFVLHTQMSPESVERLTVVERDLLEIFDSAFKEMKIRGDVRLFSHTFFAALNGILITFHRYPGRSEKEVYDHMIRLSRIVCYLFRSAAREQGKQQE